MDSEQTFQEIRDLHDQAGRQEAAIEGLFTQIEHLEQRAIPASVADVVHRLDGVLAMMSDLAGTQHKLALELANHTDRLSLLEGMTQ